MTPTELLKHINPSSLDYQSWCNVGMVLKDEGLPCSVWDAWSQADTERYKQGACAGKWKSFKGSANPVGVGTMLKYAKDQGYTPPVDHGRCYEWDDVIGGKDDYHVVDTDWLDPEPVDTPTDDWDQADQIIRYVRALFQGEDHVNYVTTSTDTGKPANKGRYDQTATELIEAVEKHRKNLTYAVGDFNPAFGAWIRFNPLDGQGVHDANVTSYRFALVESDEETIDRQRAIYDELHLPIAALVHSGNKSLHAIVRIEADTREEYRKRVEFLYRICKKNGLAIDAQNKNPARLSRMPGIPRGGNKQFLVATNIGMTSWDEWRDWIEAENDNLPDPECLADVWDNMPKKSDALIGGVLRQGHKMLLAGSSKAGKSFFLIELCIAIAENKHWLGRECSQGRVMYVNLELDRASCLHRFKDVYDALGWHPDNFRNIDIWNLRGNAVPMDKLAPKLIRRAQKKKYIAVVIDPIYKVITGDENAADKMAAFCNQFDKVCHELKAAVIYCHHHSKGAQGGKRSMDRASGSGVFARDPDAILDLIELNIPSKKHEEKDEWGYEQDTRTAWRVEGTMREFAPLKPVDIWFDYPIHRLDETGELANAKPDEAIPSWQKGQDKANETRRTKSERNQEKLILAFSELAGDGGSVALSDLVQPCGVQKDAVKKWIDVSPELSRDTSGNVTRIDANEDIKE